MNSKTYDEKMLGVQNLATLVKLYVKMEGDGKMSDALATGQATPMR